MGRDRPLILQGNKKIGEAIHHFDLPAVSTCPGRSSVCERACYARIGRYCFKKVRDRLEWCYLQSLRDSFVDTVVSEIRSKGVLVLRLHCSGDYYSAEYAEKWLTVMRLFPRVRFYFYTRSYRIKEIAPVLERMAQLRCCRAWYSIDVETGVPATIPAGVRLAYLQADEQVHPKASDLVFRTRKLRKLESLPVVCNQETVEGKADGTTCGSCKRCFD
jgi:hypothetical protein